MRARVSDNKVPLFATLSAGLAATLLAASAQADIISIGVTLASPPDGSYQLTGQSAMFKTTPDSLSTGGQLDDVASPGAVISYEEVFPPATLDDYKFFGYYGRILTKNSGGDVTDTSIIMAFRQGEGVGHRISDYFSYSEATLVAAFGTFDSPEFLDLIGGVSDNPLTRGIIEVLPIGRPGETLDLVAFTGGVDGDLGVSVGSLTYSVVPAPASTMLLLAGGAVVGRRRR